MNFHHTKVTADHFDEMLFMVIQYSTRFMPQFRIDTRSKRDLAKDIYNGHLITQDGCKRGYHGPGHPIGMGSVLVTQVLHMLDQQIFNSRALAAIYWMILLHDLIIQIGREPGWNERQSARRAVKILQLYRYPPDFIALVQSGIEATITHTLENVQRENSDIVGLFIDLDLWGLGQDPVDFASDTEQVWIEYEPHISRIQFDVDREQWATQFLKRKRLYHTSVATHLEVQARTNLKALADS